MFQPIKSLIESDRNVWGSVKTSTRGHSNGRHNIGSGLCCVQKPLDAEEVDETGGVGVLVVQQARQQQCCFAQGDDLAMAVGKPPV